MTENLIGLGDEKPRDTSATHCAVDLIAQIQVAQRDAGERAVTAHLERTMGAMVFEAAAQTAEPEPDVADIIAAALQTLEDAGAAILAAAPHVDTYLPASAPAVAYEAPTEPEPLFITLDSINDAIGEGFYMRADFIVNTLGINPTATDATLTLYNPAQRSLILRALAAHVEALA